MKSAFNDQLNKAVATVSSPSSTQHSQQPPRAEFLRGIFRQLIGYGLMANPTQDTLRAWADGLSDMSEISIRMGANKCKDFVGYFHLPAFRELCRVTAEEQGLPDPHAAYIEAAMSDGPRDRAKWSHPAVFHAGRETGWFELRTGTEKEVFPLFRRNYEIVCKRILAGEDLSIPIQKALPESVFVPADPDHARSALDSIKSLLD